MQLKNIYRPRKKDVALVKKWMKKNGITFWRCEEGLFKKVVEFLKEKERSRT